MVSSSSSMAACFNAYFELCKPRVVALMLLTALVGMYLSTHNPIAPGAVLVGLLGIGLAASSAATINHLIDRRIDAIMNRTQNRPLPTGRLSIQNVLIFAGVLAVTGLSILVMWVNWLTAILTLLTLFGYAFVYTGFLKRATPQNIVIGGLAGAIPPLLGWTAITNHLDANAWLLVLIIFVWTPPHFWALAIHRHKEYAAANIPMLPVTHGIPFTKLSILLYTILLIPISALPYATGMSGIFYLAGALLLGFGFLLCGILLKQGQWKRGAIHTFNYSIFYLAALFILLLVDHAYIP